MNTNPYTPSAFAQIHDKNDEINCLLRHISMSKQLLQFAMDQEESDMYVSMIREDERKIEFLQDLK